MKHDDSGESPSPGGGHKTLKGWPRVDLVALARTRRGASDDEDVEPTRVEPPPARPEDDEIPELPSALLELAEDFDFDDGAPASPPPPAASPSPVTLSEEVLADGAGKNRLRIRAGAFSLELEGDEAFINTVYDSVRQDLIAKMTAALQEEAPEASGPAAPPPLPASPRPESFTAGAGREDAVRVRGNGYVWVYVCHELYNKVHVVPRDLLRVSPLANVIDTRQLSRIYVNRSRLGEMEGLIGTGKTLWSELTDEGRRRLRRGGL